jgi:hypothetical protein
LGVKRFEATHDAQVTLRQRRAIKREDEEMFIDLSLGLSKTKTSTDVSNIMLLSVVKRYARFQIQRGINTEL